LIDIKSGHFVTDRHNLQAADWLESGRCQIEYGSRITVKSQSSLLCLALAVMPLSALAEMPRTPEGKPNFQGLWTNATETPVERPPQFEGRATMTAEEAMQWRPGSAAGLSDLSTGPTHLDPNRGAPPRGANIALEADWYFSTGYVATINGEFRTSLVIDPPDGRIPYADNGRGRDLRSQWLAREGVEEFDGPEVRPAGERCLQSVLPTAGPPMFPMSYNSNYRIVQTPEYLMINTEMVNDVRIIRINGEHQPPALERWMGDSVGYWEGDTLVVSTRNIHPQQTFRGSTAKMTAEERFTLGDDGQIYYRVTIEDPEVFGRPWTAEVPMRPMEPGRRVLEYACHEGNYSLVGALAGARFQEHYAEQERLAAGQD